MSKFFHLPLQYGSYLENCPELINKLIVGGERDGWRNFDEEFKRFSTHFERTEDAPCGDDTMLMYFTSGTSGYPKMVEHNFTYPLGSQNNPIQLGEMGDKVAYEQVMLAVSDFEKGNMRLSVVLASLDAK